MTSETFDQTDRRHDMTKNDNDNDKDKDKDKDNGKDKYI